MAFRLKDGAVNNKKKLKYDAVSKTWVPFSQWKKVLASREKQIDNANAGSGSNVSVPITSYQDMYYQLQIKYKHLEEAYSTLTMKTEMIKKAIFHAEKLLTLIYEL